jgi:transcriptional regulator GlxA family with amidase domain
MQTAILLFDKVTALDAVGPYEVLRQVRGWEVRFVGSRVGEIRTDSGFLGLSVDSSLEEATEPQVVLVPGGEGNRALLEDEEVLSWLRSVDQGAKWTTSVCTGSLVLGAAGLLKGKRATCHWAFLDQLRDYGADPVGGRFIEDGKTITAAGVSAGIDMALHLVGREVGPEVAQAVQLGIEYDPQPPYDAGSPSKAPPSIVEAVRAAAERPAA